MTLVLGGKAPHELEKMASDFEASGHFYEAYLVFNHLSCVVLGHARSDRAANDARRCWALAGGEV